MPSDQTATRQPAPAIAPLDPNEAQQDLITTLEGPLLCDAGAGTGKTFTIAHRYLRILQDRDLDPQDVLLITFTNNAAEEMRERILRLGGDQTTPTQLHDAPISTFHALAKRLLERHGFQAPAHLGLDARLAPGFTVLGDEVRETQIFDQFLRTFQDEHPEHDTILASLVDPSNLLTLLHEIAAKGILPTTTGWYRDSKSMLLGDENAFFEAFETANTPRNGTQAPARKRFYDAARGKLFFPPTRDRDDATDGNRIDPQAVHDAWQAPREDLLAFVHDVYVEYLEHAIHRNQLNFQFLLVLALVLLIEDDDLREREQFDYVMIDEFQDTSEIQLQLALLYAAEPNLCCVGDWKQSIYSFQYASVDNILNFDDRVQRYAQRLNADRDRVPPATKLTPAQRIHLTENYRSTQPLLDVAPDALVCPATQRETLDEDAIQDAITNLQSRTPTDESRIQTLLCDDEPTNVLALIQTIVDNPRYALHETATVDGDKTVLTRPPTYDDIAVLTRTRRFALELQEQATLHGLPVAFEGGVEVYKTDEAKLLLAWLRLLEDHRSRRGWAVILEHAGFTLPQARRILDEHAHPDPMTAFLAHLRELPTPGAKARAIFEAYDLFNGTTETLIANLQRAYEDTRCTPAELVRLIEDHHEAGTVEDVDDHPGGNVTTVQTIHAAKGLEYPIVILADVNQGRFPSTGGGYPTRLRYDETLGLRLTKRFIDETGTPPYVYDDWATTLLKSVLDTSQYDEERRLLYVALSRAKQHLLITAQQGRSSRFFEALPPDPIDYDADPSPTEHAPRHHAPLTIETPDQRVPQTLPVGELTPEPQIPEGGRGKRFGKQIHAYAARAARDQTLAPTNQHQTNVDRILEDYRSRGFQLDPEVDARLPLALDEHDIILEGKIDLVARGDGRIEILDWKTTPPGAGLRAYRRQVGLYAAIVERAHPDKTVQGWIVYTDDGSREPVQPLGADELEEAIRQALDASPPP